jgi:excisionase family DNA binding protein
MMDHATATATESAATPVTILAEDAACIIGCSYSHVIKLIHKKKLKAHKKGRAWVVCAADVHQAKESRMVTPRRRPSLRDERVDFSAHDEVELRVKVSRSKYQMLNAVLESKNQGDLYMFLTSKVEELNAKVMQSVNIAD